MPGRECYHCKQWVEEGEAHDCWTTTEAALLEDASDDLREAYERLRETARAFGEQRIYASHKSIMFSRSSCYFFVRPKRTFLEVNVFLGREVDAPQVRRRQRASARKVVHVIPIRHRDEVEPPVTDWLEEAYRLLDASSPTGGDGARTASRSRRKRSGSTTTATSRPSMKKPGEKKPGAQPAAPSKKPRAAKPRH